MTPIQLRIDPADAENFIRRMDERGFTHARRSIRDGSVEVDFIRDGVVSEDYTLVIFDTEAYVGFRPK